MPRISVKVDVPLLLFDGKYYQRDEILKVEEASLRLCLSPFVEVINEQVITQVAELATQEVDPVVNEPEVSQPEPKAETKTRRSKNSKAD